jgi:poly-gamma-glutamate synthesis protein (capsule biosynthesis protein)
MPSSASAALRLVFGGDVMLGRLVKEAMLRDGADTPLAAVAPLLREADLAIANLECAITDHPERWPGTPKAFYFGAAPLAAQALRDAGVGLLSLANNHILDYGVPGLFDTVKLLDAQGIAHAGAGRDLDAALAPVIVERGGLRIGMAAFCDHQADFAAGPGYPGMAWLPMHEGCYPEAVDAFALALASLRAAGVDWPILSLHWGPNMVSRPEPHQRRLAHAAVELGWKIVFGHSAHVFQGVELYEDGVILYAAGDLVDDYRVDPGFRNDHQLLFELFLQDGGLERMALHPLFIRRFRVMPADAGQRAWIFEQMGELCRELGTAVRVEGEVLVIEPKNRRPRGGGDPS